MAFSDGIRQFKAELRTRSRDQFFGTANEVARSVIEGSELTGAPGQPVDTGHEKAGWIPAYTSPTRFEMTNKVEYAEAIEDGVGPHGPVAYGNTGKPGASTVGGSHSVKKTIDGFQAIADHVAQKIAGGDG